MRARLILLAGSIAALSACGGAKDPLADLCVSHAAEKLQGQVYRLDEQALAASKVDSPDGNKVFKAEVILRPGTSSEMKQAFECTVAPAADGAPARVIQSFFNEMGPGLAG